MRLRENYQVRTAVSAGSVTRNHKDAQNRNEGRRTVEGADIMETWVICLLATYIPVCLTIGILCSMRKRNKKERANA